MNVPLGYHITFGTHGARLHGCDRPHVDRDHNQYGEPFAPTDPAREEAARRRMIGESVRLTVEQRVEVERAIRALADRFGWTIHAVAVQSDHAHVVITADREAGVLRDAIKAAASRALNKRFGKTRWWAEKGSTKYLWDRAYLANATGYVADQRDF